jgi:LCP family protein required for cell wall assembly
MPDQYHNQYDPTEPIQPPQPQQGKLVLGNSQNQAGPSQRKPYQYPQGQPPQTPGGQPPRYPQGQPPQQGGPPPRYPQGQPPQQGGYPQRQAGPQVPPPVSRPNDNRYPQNPGYPQPGQGAPKRKRRGRGCMITSIVLVVLVVALIIMGVVTTQRVLAFGTAISPQSPLSSQINTGSSDRTNLLIMGYGGTGHDGAYLTDSNVVVSLIPSNHHTSLISVPRDLWVSYPQGSAQRTKLNAVYTIASNGNAQPIAGGDAAAAKISVITGLDVKYWMTINFSGFRDLINTIGGVDVNVQTPFNACYPANDDPNVNAAWIKVQFNKGVQHMDGETAIRYARAREPLSVCNMGTSENEAQLTDFARSQRQQDIMKATLAKVKQMTTWPSFFNALTALQKTIYTNLSFSDLARFVLAMDLNNPNTPHIGLTNGNVLEDANLDDGTYILEPQGGNWSIIPPYIQQRLYN